MNIWSPILYSFASEICFFKTANPTYHVPWCSTLSTTCSRLRSFLPSQQSQLCWLQESGHPEQPKDPDSSSNMKLLLAQRWRLSFLQRQEKV